MYVDVGIFFIYSEADMYLSIHLNYLTNSAYYGAQVFYNKDNEGIAKKIQEYMITKSGVIDKVAFPSTIIFIAISSFLIFHFICNNLLLHLLLHMYKEIYEKDITLKITLFLEEELSKRGAGVLLIRDGDYDLSGGVKTHRKYLFILIYMLF